MNDFETFMRKVADHILEDEVKWSDEEVMCLSEMFQRLSDYLDIEAEDEYDD